MAGALSIKEAAQLVQRSTDSIYRWRANGCNVHDRKALLEYAEHQDLRSRGVAKQMSLDRSEPANAPSAFFNANSALSALSTLEALKSAFSKRLDKARAQSIELETELLSEELGMLTESARLLAAVLEGFEV
jgi:hypothetical protein